ncbi:MAG: substrate-binding domain-containing protein, partial [Pseudomonadota bacterium]
RRLQEQGLRPLLVNLTDETDPGNSVRMLRQYSVDGVVVASSTLPTAFARAFRDAGVPVVHSFGRHSSTPDVHVVGIDNVEAGRMAARELVARGYKRVAFLGGPETATSTQDRQRGFEEILAEHPGVDASLSYATAYSFDAGRKEMQACLARGAVEAYFCGDDVLSIGALSAVEDAGMAVPQDIGLIGLNDMEMAGWENINLTTIRQPIRQIVDSSVELMKAMLDEPDRYPEARLFPCRVVERETLRARPVSLG